MQSEAARVAETRSWFVKAKEDLRAAEHEFTAVPPLLGDIVFHCQQATEKALKGFLTWHDQPFRKTHDLAELGGQCVVLDPGLEQLCRCAERLTVFAWVFRYPGEKEEPTREEAEEAMTIAYEVYNAILDRLPAPVRL
jgi:HEPN domain-containing protein